MNPLAEFSPQPVSSPLHGRTLLRALLLGVSLAGAATITPTAHAQSALEARSDWHIPAGPLDAALTRFATESGANLAFEPQLVAGRQSASVSGNYTATEALNRLLAGSGITAERSGNGVFRLQRAATGGDAVTLPKMKVTANQQTVSDELPQAYAGGQVARGGQVGMLGNRDLMDTPFNQTSYTADLIENQQARTVADVLTNDPSVRPAMSADSGSEGFFIRGFPVGDGGIAFNGLAGMAPRARSSVEAIERVEVLKGASALLAGMMPDGSVGGMVMLVPKRAGDQPLTRLAVDYRSAGQLGAHVDIGRRYGEDNAIGVRFNGVARDGEGAVEDQDQKLGLASLGLDYRGERLRLALDAYSQRDRHDGGDHGVFFVGEPGRAPDSEKPLSLGTDVDAKDEMVMVRAEYDLTGQITAFAAFGEHDYRSKRVDVTPYDAQANGDYLATLYGSDNRFDMHSSEAGIRSSFATGSIQHSLTISATQYSEIAHYAAVGSAPTMSNIYNPVPIPFPGMPDDVPKTIDSDLNSYAIADTMSTWNERLTLTLGLRRQQVAVDSVWASGGPYDKWATTPMIGVVIKPWNAVSLYANYIEGLSQGPAAPTDLGLVNAGEVFPPYESEQYELGAKREWDGFGGSLSLFQISQPNSLIENNRFTVDGEQRNRGIEWNVYGMPAKGVRVLGGVVLMDAEVTKAAGSTQGNDAHGIPKRQLSLGVEWEAPFLPGLTFNARTLYTDSVYIDSTNIHSIPSWTRWDAGAWYALQIGGKPVTLRATIDNLLGEDYWMGHRWDGAAGRSEPRTITLATQVDF